MTSRDKEEDLRAEETAGATERHRREKHAVREDDEPPRDASRSGMTAQEAHDTAMALFTNNFYSLGAGAMEVAETRAEDFTDAFVSYTAETNPELLRKIHDPSLQWSLFKAQKEYAKFGTDSLKEQLLCILSERLASEDRSVKQVVLDEAVFVVPRLSQSQIDCLTLIYAVIHYRPKITSLRVFIDYVNNRIMQFFSPSFDNPNLCMHLQDSRACSVLQEGAFYKPIEDILRLRFKGLFSKGFTEEEFKTEIDPNVDKYRWLLTQCAKDPSRLQFNACDDRELQELLEKNRMAERGDKIKRLYDRTTMSPTEFSKFLTSVNPAMSELLRIWKKEQGELKTLKLTSVGYVIAFLNFHRTTGGGIPLDSVFA